jgi:hypothetical protein
MCCKRLALTRFAPFSYFCTAERDARVGAMSGNGWSSRHAKGRYPRSQWASGHGRYPASREVAEFMPDPGELAADRWNETHR